MTPIIRTTKGDIVKMLENLPDNVVVQSEVGDIIKQVKISQPLNIKFRYSGAPLTKDSVFDLSPKQLLALIKEEA